MKIARIFYPFTANLHYIIGILLIIIACFLTVSLITYSASDPSFNLANDNAVHNYGGVYGAFIVDPLLQLFGGASALFAIIPLCWGIRIVMQKEIQFWLVRIAFLLLAVMAVATVFNLLFTKPNDEIFHNGYIGYYVGIKLKAIWPLTVPLYIMPISVLLISIMVIFIASSLTFKECSKIGDFITYILCYLWKLIKITFIVFSYPFISIYRRKKVEEQNVSSNFSTELKRQLKSTTRPKMKQIVKHAIEPLGSYKLPYTSLLNVIIERGKKHHMSNNLLAHQVEKLEQVLNDFGIYGQITDVHQGPVVILYELEPKAGTKSSRIIGLADDIARSMSAISARIAVIPGRNVIGIELPNQHREMVYLRELLETDQYKSGEEKLPLILGKDIAGKGVIADLTRMPHLLVAGTTGSGKSVAINVMILSLLYRLTPKECKFIMIDPKMLELSVYEGIPHLLTPVVTEPQKAVVALKWVVKEMENRYRTMSNLGVRNIAGYNKYIMEAKAKGKQLTRSIQTGFDAKTGKPINEQIPISMEPLPFIVVIVDEMADLMLVAGKDIEGLVQRLSQMARAAGIHMIMATQRPSVDVITGVIKANFPTRVSFQVTSRIDSRTILGEQGGAEQLLGQGDMLYMSGGGKIVRVHGPFVEDQEVEKIVSYLMSQGSPEYIEDITYNSDDEEEDNTSEGEYDDLYDKAVELVQRERKASTSYIQRYFRIGYNRAANIIECMEKEGVVSNANHVGRREVLIKE
ncbi:DNA translocase FtsK [Rickettsiales bacterium Ac37b]|nr:DNA translocase FtsK [Rickettsiales bacterium Ac37b]